MEITKSDIQKLIEVKKEDTIKNHFLYSITKQYRSFGEIKENTIKVWKRTNTTGMSYPIFTFEFNSENKLIKTTDKLNPIAKFSQLLFPLFFFFPLLLNAFTDFEFKRFFACISAFLFLTFVCYLVSNKISKYEKKEQLNDFYKIIGVKTEDKQEREWSKSKILTRLFTYPFCFALILISIFSIIPERGFLLAIPMLGIIGIYLYCDLKLIFEDKKIKNNSAKAKT
ncbi:hypothetical protein L0669_00780 [Flavobacterium bizetiae]|uniref:hypothetical protein n=1 Tax=Flavobacterium bizetiae TaxID=2704140 RepID=UPI0021E8B3B6|nr:hypothetical protein [Flavobacterium bizetiae]UTN04451.1 hypothetical protein L0669_00780 [Flavobacterium bizetiae]